MALYDWANSSYFVIIQTFVFAAYFAETIAENVGIGTAQWGNMIGFAGIFIAITAPFFGAIADQAGKRKPWIAFLQLYVLLEADYCGLQNLIQVLLYWLYH